MLYFTEQPCKADQFKYKPTQHWLQDEQAHQVTINFSKLLTAMMPLIKNLVKGVTYCSQKKNMSKAYIQAKMRHKEIA